MDIDTDLTGVLGTTDLTRSAEVRRAVAQAYASLPHGAGRAVARSLYTPAQLAGLPEAAIDWALGVGNPVPAADLQEGEVVLDVGCGGGIDSLLAARQVGPSGRVIGVDLLPQMCQRAAAAAEAAGVRERCAFMPGEMEDLPLDDDSVDVVVSNGAINLSPRKSRALAEIARVLRPGGRLCASDLVVEGALPPAVLGSPSAWAGCIAGALSEGLLRRKLERVGMAEVRIGERVAVSLTSLTAYPLLTADAVELMRRTMSTEDLAHTATSILVQAAKPAHARRSASGSGVALWATGVRHLDQLTPDATEAPGVTVRHLASVEDVQLKVLDVVAGGSTPFHTHRHAHEGIVVSGRGHLRLADRREPLQPGCAFTVNPTEEHAIVSAADDPLRFVCMDCLV